MYKKGIYCHDILATLESLHSELIQRHTKQASNYFPTLTWSFLATIHLKITIPSEIITMYAKSLLAAAFLATFVAAAPAPGTVNAPITDIEWDALTSGGLKARSLTGVNVPITEEEMKALEVAGLKARSEGSLVARDHKMNCGHKVTGKGGSNGHGKWIPVGEFTEVAETFCKSSVMRLFLSATKRIGSRNISPRLGGAYTGTDISKGHETSDTHGISLTNQKDKNAVGPAGNIVFAIYNTEREGSYVVDRDSCLSAMKAPLGNRAVKRDGVEYVRLGKRDECWGHKNNDYEGGYWKVDGVGAFGSEVYAA